MSREDPSQDRAGGALVGVGVGVGCGLGAMVVAVTGDGFWMPVVLAACIASSAVAASRSGR